MRLHTDRALIRAAGRSRRYALLSLTAPSAPRQAARRPINVALVLDRSGSMAGRKLELVREAARRALSLLRPEDRFALVVYDDRIDLLMPSTLATSEARQRALELLDRVDARGNTDLGGGWLNGCEQVAAGLSPDGTGKCLLLTDGLANQGITDRDELAGHAAELRDRRVLTSAFGVGADFDELLLQQMATRGGGHFYFIEQPAQIPDLLASELGETLEVVARDARLDLRLPGGVQAEVLSDFPATPSSDGLGVELGNLVSDQEVQVVLGLRFPAGVAGERLAVAATLEDHDHRLGRPAASAEWWYAGHPENDAQARDVVVDRAVGGVYAARARRAAVEANRRGDCAEAVRLLRATANKIRTYAGRDAELLTVIESLLQLAREFDRPMDPLMLKRHHFASLTSLRGRDAEGRAKRSQGPSGK